MARVRKLPPPKSRYRMSWPQRIIVTLVLIWAGLALLAIVGQLL